MRTELTADTDFYCSLLGNDSNDGLTALTPKRQPNTMAGVLLRDYDWRGFIPRILCGNGSYDPIAMSGKAVGQSQPMRISGSVVRGACTISAPASPGVQVFNSDLLIEGFSISSPNSYCLQATTGAAQLYYRDIEFLLCQRGVASEKIAQTFYLSTRDNLPLARQTASMPSDGSFANYWISGNCSSHIYANEGGVAIMTESNGARNPITFTAPLVFGIGFVDAIQSGDVTCHTNAFSGPTPKVATPATAGLAPSSYVASANDIPAVYSRWSSAVANVSAIPGSALSSVADTSSFMGG